MAFGESAILYSHDVRAMDHFSSMHQINSQVRSSLDAFLFNFILKYKVHVSISENIFEDNYFVYQGSNI